MTKPMDPDRYQMRDLKSRLSKLERRHERLSQVVDRWRKKIKED